MLLTCTTTDEHVHNVKTGIQKLKSLKERVRKIYADKDYNSKSIYNTFREDAIIPPGRNASTK